MADGSGNTTYSYDQLDRLTTKAAPAGTLSYSYDGAGNLASISSNHANGVLVSYAYDELNRLSTVTDGRLQGNQTTTYTYDSASNVVLVTYPNSTQGSFTYDTLNRLTGMTTPASSYSYQVGPTGNRLSVTESNGRTISWNYDGIYRLTNETITGDPSQNNGSASYALDPVGNRLSLNSTLPGIESGSLGYNADDEVSSETYDLNGNTLTASGKTFAYDSENHLTSMNGGQVQIVYDGDGNRAAKTVGGITTQYLVDDLNPTGYSQVLEEVVNGAVTRQYTYGLQRISENQAISNAWMPSFYGYDGSGSVRQLTNSVGVVTDEYEYDAYGNSFTKSGTTPNNYLYRGEQYDSDLGLYYLRARYYNPATGRFLSRDPEDGWAEEPATQHKYLYASGDPANRVDPSGRLAVEYPRIVQFLVTAAIPGLIVYRAAVVCLYGWDTTRFNSTVDTGLYGGYTHQAGPCQWLWSRRKKQADPYPRPPDTTPGPAPGPPPPGCPPCPPLPPPWCAPGNAHGSINGVHYHWYVWDQAPYPDCTCRARRMSGPTCPW
jgi:RHS repeat-associated protein